MRPILNFLTLFTSLSTLLCCALPALLVALGMGAAMAGFLSKYPQLIWLSENKLALFITGAAFLTVGGFIQFKQKQLACPIEKKEACSETRSLSRWIYGASVLIYLIGLSFAYILPHFI